MPVWKSLKRANLVLDPQDPTDGSAVHSVARLDAEKVLGRW